MFSFTLHRSLSPRLALAGLLVLLLALVACTSVTAVPSASATVANAPDNSSMSSEARQFLQDSLTWIRENAVMGHRLDWIALDREAMALVAGARTTADTYPAIRLALERLNDKQGAFTTPEQNRIYAQIQNRAMGITFRLDSQTVAFSYPDGPAYRAGLRIGDKVEAVNGVAVNGDAYWPIIAAVTQGGAVQLGVRHPGSSQPVDMSVTPGAVNWNPAPTVRQVEGNIGYIDLTPMSTDKPEELTSYAATIQQGIAQVDGQGACGWLVDLRRDVGGNMWAMLAGVGPLLGEGEVGAFDDTQGGYTRWTYQAGKSLNGDQVVVTISSPYSLKRASPPVAVLTGPGTIISGEAIAIAFRGRPNTRSFGEPTAGKTGSPIGLKQTDGSSIVVTLLYMDDRAGKSYADSIAPDQLVPMDYALVGTDRDPVVLAAVDWLKQQSACK